MKEVAEIQRTEERLLFFDVFKANSRILFKRRFLEFFQHTYGSYILDDGQMSKQLFFYFGSQLFPEIQRIKVAKIAICNIGRIGDIVKFRSFPSAKLPNLTKHGGMYE